MLSTCPSVRPSVRRSVSLFALSSHSVVNLVNTDFRKKYERILLQIGASDQWSK